MANSNIAAVQAIKAAAAKYGLDPQAMIAVARAESGLRPDAIGDGGHAFGLFQFNNAGGTITGQANPERYLDPNFNAMEAARHIASIKGARGARGKTAVELIVNQFERPANKSGEISKALSYYGKDGAPAPTVGLGNAQTAVEPSQTVSNGLLSQTGTSGQSINSNPLESLLGAAMSGSTTDGSNDTDYNLLKILTQPVGEEQVTQPTLPAAAATPTQTGTLPTGDYGKVTSLPAKIIGTPYQGTHRVGNWQSDNAVDIAMPKGTPIYATEDGTIGNRIGALDSKNPRFAGLRVNLAGKDNAFYYAHLSKLAVKAGQKVKKGELLGYSGEANGVAHLHLGVEKGSPKTYA